MSSDELPESRRIAAPALGIDGVTLEIEALVGVFLVKEMKKVAAGDIGAARGAALAGGGGRTDALDTISRAVEERLDERLEVHERTSGRLGKEGLLVDDRSVSAVGTTEWPTRT